jgi:hypothetical protein
MWERPLFRVSPMGADFVGRCKLCMDADEVAIDPELVEVVEDLTDAADEL